MKSLQLHSASVFAGCGIAALALLLMSQTPPPSASKGEHGVKWGHKVVNDMSTEDAQRLADDGWEYVGYLGTGTRGASNDETLWKKLAK